MSIPLKTNSFDFHLPTNLIAQTACEPRDHARLLHSKAVTLQDHHVFDLPTLLHPGDLLILNNTKVIPARLMGHKGTTKIELLLHKKLSDQTWLTFARPGKRLHMGNVITFAPNFIATVMEKRETGEIVVTFNLTGAEFWSALDRFGEPPLPPYIHRNPGTAHQDKQRYQTTYAEHDGSIAAPTAGLHFTKELLEHLTARGIEHHFVTLHVGAGTFLPVKTDTIQEHKMHAEWGQISPSVAAAIQRAQQQGRRIVAVGTTALRLLETAADEQGKVHPFEGETSIFIYPGYRFRAVDVLLTNFHLPQSTLYMLVCAFIGMDRAKKLYEYAIAKEYRFYSYGDATLLEKE